MTSLREFLLHDPLGSGAAELMRRAGYEKFGDLLPSSSDAVWYRLLARFAQSAPWRYWDREMVVSALEILEMSPERTEDAISTWSRRIGIAFENAMRPTATHAYEEDISSPRAKDWIRLSNEFHPEYLRYAQHVFGNLLVLFWAVLKKKSVRGDFSIPGAIALLESKHCSFLLSGYSDDIRNAIAHGEVVFQGLGEIVYGTNPTHAPYQLSTSEFLYKFDTLWRTSNAMVIAMLLFVARNKRILDRRADQVLPAAVIALIAGAAVERAGMTVEGAVESEVRIVGRQLHVALRTSFLSRTMALGDCARLALHLLENGAVGYSRYLFEIDHGRTVSSLVIVSATKLKQLVKENASVEQLGEIFADTPMVWYDESGPPLRLKGYRIIGVANARLAAQNIQRDLAAMGWRRGAGRYHIRHVRNSSAGTARIEVVAVLRYPADSDDRAVVKEITRRIIREVSKLSIRTHPSGLEKGRNRYTRPRYVWIRLYKIDGTLRWLARAGQLVVHAEKVYGFWRLPIAVRQPDEVWHGIRLRYGRVIANT